MSHLRLETPTPVGVSFALLAILLSSCTVAISVPDDAPHYAGTFEATCSPVDAPGTLIELYRLGDAFPAQVSISIWEFELPVEDTVVELDGRSGYASAYVGGTEWIPAGEGEIGLEHYVEGEIARGWFWLDLDQVERVEGRFEASWSDEGLEICG